MQSTVIMATFPMVNHSSVKFTSIPIIHSAAPEIKVFIKTEKEVIKTYQCSLSKEVSATLSRSQETLLEKVDKLLWLLIIKMKT